VKTTVEKLSPTRVKLNISVTPEELKPSIAHAYEHIGSQVNIPGFRKGKIPPQLIDQRVGREEVLNHAVSDGLDKFYRQAVTDSSDRRDGFPPRRGLLWNSPSTGCARNQTPSGPVGKSSSRIKSHASAFQSNCPCDCITENTSTLSPEPFGYSRRRNPPQVKPATGTGDRSARSATTSRTPAAFAATRFNTIGQKTGFGALSTGAG